ncbi:DUF2474 domain-containing protein [Sphingomonas psychrolutea]|nr:DUF2474 domain-containing protein [Sphingomonas psychrolutea]
MIVDDPAVPFWRRLAWMAGIWAMSVTALAVVAFGIRVWLRA